MSATAFKTTVAAGVLISGAVVSFNGFLWQIYRRRWKQQLMESHNNFKQPVKKALPTTGDRLEEFSRVELEGTLDNEGTVLVGPRPFPLTKNKTGAMEENKGGFAAVTPFEVAHTRQIVMVHRGWVPIDAAKSRLHMTRYLGEGYKPTTISGFLKREEWISSWYNFDPVENHQPVHGGMCWFAIRPFDMAVQYFTRRWGADALEERKTVHGARPFFVEMYEDHSGHDQVLVNGIAIPVRKDTADLTYVAITPTVHAMYAAFWLSVTAGCLFGLNKLWKANYRSAVLRRQRDKSRPEHLKAVQDEQQRYFDEVKKAMSSPSGGGAGSAAATAANVSKVSIKVGGGDETAGVTKP